MIEYLLYPSVRSQDGTGHLVRMIRLHQQLDNSCLYIPEREHASLLQRIPSITACRIVHEWGQPRLIVLDMPWVDESLLMNLQARAPLVAIDLGGRGRFMASFLIDTLPYPGHAAHYRHFKKYLPARSKPFIRPGLPHVPNLCEPGFLLSGEKKTPASDIHSVLVTFGGSDPKCLTRRFVKHLWRSSWLRSLSGKIILNADNRQDLPENWEYTRPASSLSEFLREADLCFCSYGLSAWEAHYAGVRTVVMNASAYHRHLSRLSGFASFPLNAYSLRRVSALRERLLSQVRRVQDMKCHSLAEYVARIKPAGSVFCPCCGNEKHNHALSRGADRSYFRCSVCGTIYLQRLLPSKINYDRKYFFEQYEEQYGRTYLEDFDHITALGLQRMSIIRKIQGTRKQPRLLDIGCAYGPFMVASAQSGYLPEGMDINEGAVLHVKEKLGFKAWRGDIGNESFRRGFESKLYDVITLWYVIEHFPDLSEILPWISRHLKPHGICALSTPNSLGISGRKNLSDFLQRGPEDHYSVWNQVQARRVGRIYGLQLKRWRSIGHHGERFPGILGFRPLRAFSHSLSRFLSLGDGLEAYFVKESVKEND